MQIIFNNQSENQTLMIHSFKGKDFNNTKLININGVDDNINLELDKLLVKYGNNYYLNEDFEKELDKFNYITFDDGLYQQIEFIKLFKLISKDKIIFFPSFGLLRPEQLPPNPIDNSIAHRNKKSSLSTFMTSTEAWDLMQSGYKLGMHGWYHLNLNLNHSDLNEDGLNGNRINYLKIIKNDAKLCAKAYVEFVKKLSIVKDISNIKEHYYCTPYNIMNDLQKLYIEFLAKYLTDYLKQIPTLIPHLPQHKLIIFSNERISIENFIKESLCHYVKD